MKQPRRYSIPAWYYLMTMIPPFLLLPAALGYLGEAGYNWRIEEIIGLEGAANLLISGTIAVVAFRLNAAALAGRDRTNAHSTVGDA